MASKIIAIDYKKETDKEIEKIIRDFLIDLILEDKIGLYHEEFEYLIKDLEKTKNYNEFVILNPYLVKNHNSKYFELMKRLKEFIFTEKCRYIVNLLKFMKETNFNLEELREFDMQNFKIFNLVIFNHILI